MKKLRQFVLDSFDELKHKVTWPPFSQLQSSSVLVLVASLIFALVIGAIDFVFDQALTWFYDQF